MVRKCSNAALQLKVIKAQNYNCHFLRHKVKAREAEGRQVVYHFTLPQ